MSDKILRLEDLDTYDVELKKNIKENYIEPLKKEFDNKLDSKATVATFNIAAANTTITLQNLEGMTQIDWGDGTVDNNLMHTYSNVGEYICKIYSVTLIGNSTFKDCRRLTSVVIPDGVTMIGGLAFYNCSSLKSVIIPDSVTTISSLAFSNCSSLISLIIPNGVTTINSKAFWGCSSLKSVVIPDSVTNIWDDAFTYCTSLTSVVIKNIFPFDYNSQFLGCILLTHIYIPYGSKQAYINKWTVDGATQDILDKLVESDREATMSDINKLIKNSWCSHNKITSGSFTTSKNHLWKITSCEQKSDIFNKTKYEFELLCENISTTSAVSISMPSFISSTKIGIHYEFDIIGWASILEAAGIEHTTTNNVVNEYIFELVDFWLPASSEIDNNFIKTPYYGSQGCSLDITISSSTKSNTITPRQIRAKVNAYKIIGEYAAKIIANKIDSNENIPATFVTKISYPAGSIVSFKYYIPEDVTVGGWAQLCCAANSYKTSIYSNWIAPIPLTTKGQWLDFSASLTNKGYIYFATAVGEWSDNGCILIDNFRVSHDGIVSTDTFNSGVDKELFYVNTPGAVELADGYIEN